MFKAFFAIALLTIPVQATEIGCATDPTAVVAGSAHRSRVYAKAATAAEMRNGMFVVAKSQDNVTLDHPNDLEGRSIRFVPAGGDRYTATALGSQYDSDAGPQLRQFVLNTSQSNWHYVKVDLKNTFTLLGQNVRSIYVTAFNSITLAPPEVEYSTQYDTNGASFTGVATISPLLMTATRMSGFNWPTAYLREASDSVLVTWRALGNVFSYDVQARISTTGEIVFSYKTLGKVTWGAAVITPGAGPFMSRLKPVAQAPDEAGDAKPELDVTSIAVQHVEGTGAYLLLVTFGADLLKTPPARGDSMVVSIAAGDGEPLTVTIGWNKSVSFSGGGGSVEGNQLQAAVFAPASRVAHMVIETSLLSMNAIADRATVDVDMTGGFIPGVDLSEASGTSLQLPIVEAFTVPMVDLQSVWDSVRATAPLKDNEIDGVAVFENFNVDAVLKSAAWATIGNSGADGVWKFVRHGSAYPREPNLMQMNVMEWVQSTTPEGVAGTLMHEFGHRWLQFVETIEDGTPTITLNPSPAHPPQFASAPAAFPVFTPYDTSVMGGGYFAQAGNTFTASVKSAVGYSWFDLYLMGLATEQEVPPMYVIDGTNLGAAYTPPSNVVVTGTRHDVTLQQVIAAMGPRRPSASSSQHEFKVVFVLLSEPGRNVDADLAGLERVRSTFVEMFGKATGRRAFVETLFNPAGAGGRRRAVRP